MKLTKFLRGIALSISATFFFASCQKDNSSNFSDPSVTENNSRVSGVVEDDPALVQKVPMIISSDFSTHFIEPTSNTLSRGKQDNTLPTVSITTPSNASTVSGTVTVRATASDNVGVKLVTLSVDGIAIATTSSSPYSILWNSATVSNANHTLTISAKDAAGNTRSVSIQVIVNNIVIGDITRPTVSITSPATGSSVTGTINVGVSGSDNVGISSVRLSADGTLISTLTSSPFSFSLNTTTLASGTHTLTATATDAAGNTNTHSIQVTVNTTVLPPLPIPASFQLATPPVGNQGNEGSCVAFATAYAARSIEHYYKTSATGFNTGANIFSPEYVYNQTKFGDCGTGTAITLALDLLKNQGVSTYQSMPYSDVNGCSLMPTGDQVANASSYKISSYAAIPNIDQLAIKTMIASKHPVIATLIMDNSIVNAGTGFLWNTYSGSGSLPHTLIICGYDDAKNAYKVMNSWGTSWGDAGFTWIDYNFFPQKSSYYTYVIQ
ncbi:MAG: Ig-like domain-containing protein [Bacteroidota bacterium]